jgi:tRNA A-37 threonylcarbamoyl transferase component Bud32
MLAHCRHAPAILHSGLTLSERARAANTVLNVDAVDCARHRAAAENASEGNRPVDDTKPLNGQDSRAGQPGRLREGDEVGSYLVLAHLFTGGMGEVYAAVHQQLDRHVALKVPRLDTSAADFNRRRLLAEARFLARVAHANVVAVYDFAAADDRLEYLVMELLDGRSLDEILVKTPQLTLPYAIRIVKEMARGLAAFHRAGIYQVDLKPENVMIVTGPLVNKHLEGENWVKLIDLGTARLTYEHTDDRELSLIGTPAYMAPETILGQAVDARADLYGLGIVFYEILGAAVRVPTGRRAGRCPGPARRGLPREAPGPASAVDDRVPRAPRRSRGRAVRTGGRGGFGVIGGIPRGSQ